MKIKSLVNIFDIEKGRIYKVLAKTKDIKRVKVLDEKGEIMFLFNDEHFQEFEIVEE